MHMLVNGAQTDFVDWLLQIMMSFLIMAGGLSEAAVPVSVDRASVNRAPRPRNRVSQPAW